MSRSGPNASLSDGIATLTKMNAKLERMLAKIGTKADNSEFRDRMHQEQNAATQLVKEIIGQLKTNHSESAVFHRLRTQFEKEFKRYQGLNTQMDQRQVRVIDAVKARKTSAAGAGGHYDEEDPLTARQQTTYSDDYNGRNGYPQTQQQQQQQQQQLTAADLDIQFIEYDIEELEKRQREIGQIEQDVQEVSEMFKDLSSMVNEQQANIDLIDGSIYQAKEKTELAHKELLEAEEYQKKSRKKKCCVLFLILAVIAVIVIVVTIAK